MSGSESNIFGQKHRKYVKIWITRRTVLLLWPSEWAVVCEALRWGEWERENDMKKVEKESRRSWEFSIWALYSPQLASSLLDISLHCATFFFLFFGVLSSLHFFFFSYIVSDDGRERKEEEKKLRNYWVKIFVFWQFDFNFKHIFLLHDYDLRRCARKSFSFNLILMRVLFRRKKRAEWMFFDIVSVWNCVHHHHALVLLCFDFRVIVFSPTFRISYHCFSCDKDLNK